VATLGRHALFIGMGRLTLPRLNLPVHTDLNSVFLPRRATGMEFPWH
jgi:hypothetical protein